jgi:hypothetical protein
MNGKGQLKRRFNIEAAFAAISAALVILTLINHEWIEVLTGWDPDKGNGALEWGIVVVLVAACVAFSARARSDWQKLQTMGA